MSTGIVELLLAVRASDEDARRRGRLLAALLWGQLPMTGAFCLMAWLFPALFSRLPAAWPLLGLVAFCGCAGLLLLNRAGHSRPAGWLFLAFTTSMLSFFPVFSSLDRLLILYVIPVTSASFILFPAASWIFALLACSLYTVAAVVQGELGAYNFFTLPTIGFMALTAWLCSRGLEKALAQARCALGSQEYASQALSCEVERRSAAAAALAAETERLQVVLRAIADGVICTDGAGNVALMNRAAEDLTGWSAAQSSGKAAAGILTLINADTQWRIESPIEQVLKSGEILVAADNTVLVSRDGVQRQIFATCLPLRMPDGVLIGTALVIRDITERQRTEDTLRSSQRMESIGILASGVAHDFNNLLNGIFGNIELAAENARRGECAKTVEHLSASLQVFGRARDLSRQLYTFCKGDPSAEKSVPLAWLLKDTVQFALSGSGITPQFSMPEDLWPCGVDETQLRQVIDNIIINARQAMAEGGTVSIAARNVEVAPPADAPSTGTSFICVSIRDQGCGISREHLGRIFDPFFTTRQQGAGLGLSIAASIVKKHGGSITVDSEPGKGAIFHVYLPAATAGEVVTVLHGGEVARGQGRILLMDDEAFMREVTARMLRSAGYEVETVADGAEAQRLFKLAYTGGQGYDVVVLDLTITGGAGGKSTVPKLLFIDPQVKAIASSGSPDDEVILHPHRFGFHATLLKPYTRHEICALVQRVLSEKNG